jgi:hypothetical protein
MIFEQQKGFKQHSIGLARDKTDKISQIKESRERKKHRFQKLFIPNQWMIIHDEINFTLNQLGPICIVPISDLMFR